MKYRKLDEKGWAHWILPVIVIGLLTATAIHVIYNSHAATPEYIAVNDLDIGRADFQTNPAANQPSTAVPQVAESAQQATGGILPPDNPSESLPPNPNFNGDGDCPYYIYSNTSTCNNNVLSATDNTLNVLESLPPLSFNLNAFQSLTPEEQIFVTINIERVDRGLTPITALTTQLNGVAQTGASDNTDPILSSNLTGNVQVVAWASIFAGGTNNPLGSDYYWMYDDGPGGINGDCTYAGEAGCWGHRDVILGSSLYSQNCTNNPSTYMGTGYTSGSASSSILSTYAAILVGACGGTPSDVVFTWQQALQLLNGTITPPGAPQQVTATPDKKSVITLNWHAPNSDGGASVTSYKIYRGTKPGKEKLIKTVNCTLASCSFKNSTDHKDTTYYYVIAAVNSAGAGPISAEVSVTSS
ncbi:MAG TPA: fibronectin type III domain-containing protein [Candidatus Saccharimonadales bacterium]|nr:fibronectin type III domain-containing protein [Candidatus Saccharimonadales bacterium]